MFSRPRFKFLNLLIVLMICLSGLAIFLEINLAPTVIAVAEAKTRLLVTKIINEAVYNNVSEKINYEDIMIIHKDNQSRIVMMMPNTVKVNKMATEICLDIEKRLSDLRSQGVGIPLGQVSGSTLFANTGPLINVGIIPVGTIDVKIADEFREAGINQTKHRIVLNITTVVRIVVPLMKSDIQVAMQVPVSESIIIGPVPEWYMKFDSGTSSVPIPPIGVPGKSPKS